MDGIHVPLWNGWYIKFLTVLGRPTRCYAVANHHHAKRTSWTTGSFATILLAVVTDCIVSNPQEFV